jgi:hypothetical protein
VPARRQPFADLGLGSPFGNLAIELGTLDEVIRNALGDRALNLAIGTHTHEEPT